VMLRLDNSMPETETVVVDDMLPSQWLDRVGASLADMPERRLLVAVLFDAIRLLHYGGIKQRDEVIAWIQGRNGTARIPFTVLCDGLNLEPREFARRVLQTSLVNAPRRRTRTGFAQPPRDGSVGGRNPGCSNETMGSSNLSGAVRDDHDGVCTGEEDHERHV
jgi:hypothetical protein